MKSISSSDQNSVNGKHTIYVNQNHVNNTKIVPILHPYYRYPGHGSLHGLKLGRLMSALCFDLNAIEMMIAEHDLRSFLSCLHASVTVLKN